MELRRYLSILRSRAWFIVATVVLAAAAGYVVSDTESEYVAQTTIYVGASSIAADPVPGELSNDRLTAIQLMVLNFAKMIDSETIARSALADLGLERDPSEVVESTTAEPEPGTQLLYVTVTDPDPEMAQTLANGLADTFVKDIQEFEPGVTEGTVPRLPAYVFERAELPEVPVPTNRIRTVALAAVFGLLVAAGTALLLDYLDITIRSTDDVERRLELPVLGVIPAIAGELPPERLNTPSHPRAVPGA